MTLPSIEQVASTAPVPVVVLLSGRGSNMRVMAEQARDGKLPISISAVVSDRADAGGIAIARDLGLPVATLSPRDFANRSAFDTALADLVETYAPRLVLLAGYMRILSGAFVGRFLGRLVNIHPSLLPKYPGLYTHRRALEAGDREHGVTVHFVTEDLDAGPLIAQARVPIVVGDTEAVLSARVQQAEHILYPHAVDWLARGRVLMRDGVAWMDGKALIVAPVVDMKV
ncbi:MAG TPA: phosphoribosylglycinamide formyltransferase [Steroidobacteraceae bacterium]|nr:phosphoribosylglycinamide formyltransferase [Steroidobacteraceae bacterium]